MIKPELIVCTEGTNRTEARDLHIKLDSYLTPELAELRRNSRLDEDFYFSKQWDESELALNKQNQNYTVTINMIQRAVDFVVGMLTSQKPKIAAIPLSPKYTYQCNLAMKIWEWHYEKNRGIRFYRDYVKLAAINNMGFIFMYADENGFPVSELLTIEDVIPDPSSRKPMYEDMRSFFVRRTMPVEEAVALFGIKEQLSTQPTTQFSASYGAENQIKGTELADNRVDVYNNIPTGPVFIKNNTLIEIYEHYVKRKIPVTIDGKEVMQTRIVKETLIGYEYVYREVFPESITEFPLVPLYVRKSMNPYGTGLVETLREPQKFANKIHGVMLKNAITIGFPKTLIPKNMVPGNNFEKFRKAFNGNTIIEYNPIGGDAAAQIKTIQGQPISDSIIQMYNSALGLMEYNTAPKESMGYQNTNKDLINAGGMAQSKSMVIDSFRLLEGNIEDAINQHALILLQFVRAFMPMEAVIEISAGLEAIESVQLNRKMKLDPNNPESVAAFTETKTKEGLHPDAISEMVAKAKDDDAYLDSIADFIVNDSSELKVALKVVPESLNSEKNNAEYNILLQLQAMGVQIPPELLLKHAPIQNKNEIISKISTTAKLQQEIMGAKAAIEQAQAELQKKDQQIIELQKQMQLKDHETTLEKIENDTRIKNRGIITQQRAAANETSRQLSVSAQKLLIGFESLLKSFEEGKGSKEDIELVRDTLINFANGGE